jgi:arginase family enzyme
VENIVNIGARYGIEGAAQLGINVIPYTDVCECRIEEIAKDVIRKIHSVNSLYISIDIDVLDPAYAPGVSSPLPGGLSTRELLKFLRRILNHRVVGIDIVETNPLRDINDMTIRVAANIVKYVISNINRH